MARNVVHPVWDVYDKQRTARLNVKYYGVKLRTAKRVNLLMEVLIALSASSVVAGLRFLQQLPWRLGWEVLAGVAALLAILKPLLGLAGRIQRLQELVQGYQVLDHDLGAIAVAAHQRNVYDEELRNRFEAALVRMRELIPKETQEPVSTHLRRRCQMEVLKELPATHYYIPEGGATNGGKA